MLVLVQEITIKRVGIKSVNFVSKYVCLETKPPFRIPCGRIEPWWLIANMKTILKTQSIVQLRMICRI